MEKKEYDRKELEKVHHPDGSGCNGANNNTLSLKEEMDDEAAKEKAKFSCLPHAVAPEESLRGKFIFMPIGPLLFEPKPAQWLIKHLIEKDTITELFGETTAGKSFLALDWCCSIATGQDWEGKKVRQGAVFYIAGEGYKGLLRRCKAWSLHHNVPLDNAPLAISSCPSAFLNEGNPQLVMEAINALDDKFGPPALIVLDTLARNLGDGDENSNSDLGRFINIIDTQLRVLYGCNIIIIHHPGNGDKNRSRGGSCLPSAVDYIYQLKKDSNGAITLVCHKNKEGEEYGDQHFRLKSVPIGWFDEDGDEMTSAVLVPSTPPDVVHNSTDLKGQDRVAFKSLQKLIIHGQPPCPDLIEEFPAPDTPDKVVEQKVWRQSCDDAGMSDGGESALKKAFQRAQISLTKKGLIQNFRDWFWILPVAAKNNDHP